MSSEGVIFVAVICAESPFPIYFRDAVLILFSSPSPPFLFESFAHSLFDSGSPSLTFTLGQPLCWGECSLRWMGSMARILVGERGTATTAAPCGKAVPQSGVEPCKMAE